MSTYSFFLVKDIFIKIKLRDFDNPEPTTKTSFHCGEHEYSNSLTVCINPSHICDVSKKPPNNKCAIITSFEDKTIDIFKKIMTHQTYIPYYNPKDFDFYFDIGKIPRDEHFDLNILYIDDDPFNLLKENKFEYVYVS
jgi:hypothetical protein